MSRPTTIVVQHHLDLADARYRAKLLAAVVRARESGANTLTAICRQCHGAFPTLVWEVLQSTDGGPDVPHRAWRDEEPGLYDAALPSMPEPHPLDYEWRYTAATADALADYLGKPGTRVACFGTPT